MTGKQRLQRTSYGGRCPPAQAAATATLGVMKSHTPTFVLVIASMLVASLLTLRDAKAQSWLLEVKTRAPVYENEAYPYGSNSPPNRVVAYLQPGEKPQVISGGF